MLLCFSTRYSANKSPGVGALMSLSNNIISCNIFEKDAQRGLITPGEII
jgi:hypothetical protein